MSTTRKIVCAALVAHQKFISPVLPPACRFHPTCSEYARQAVERYGVLRGGWAALKRLARCHPLSAGGVDTLR